MSEQESGRDSPNLSVGESGPSASGEASRTPALEKLTSAPDYDPAGFWIDLKDVLRKIRTLAPVVCYFFIYWQAKDRLRTYLHRSAVVYLSFTLAFFLLEIFLKYGSMQLFQYLQDEVQPTLAQYAALYHFLIIVSGIVVLWHAWQEMRGKTEEHRLIAAVWYLFNRGNYTDEISLMKSTLPIIANAFAKANAVRVCVWLPQQQGALVVKDHCLHDGSGQTSTKILRKLEKNQGIAGRVFSDSKTRYVPRVYFPFNQVWMRRLSIPFPHALVFSAAERKRPPKSSSNESTRKSSMVVDQIKQLEVVAKEVSMDAIVTDNLVEMSTLRSFVAVPVASFRKMTGNGEIREKPMGVLCIDFEGTDPLRSDGVKLAAVFGVLLAMDLERLSVNE